VSGYSAPRPISEHDVVADFDSGELHALSMKTITPDERSALLG